MLSNPINILDFLPIGLTTSLLKLNFGFETAGFTGSFTAGGGGGGGGGGKFLPPGGGGGGGGGGAVPSFPIFSGFEGLLNAGTILVDFFSSFSVRFFSSPLASSPIIFGAIEYILHILTYIG